MLLNLAGKIAGIPFLGKRALPLLIGNKGFFLVDKIYDQSTRRIATRLIVELPGRGCVWYKTSGGCSMCGFNRKLEELNAKWKFSANDMFGLYKIAELLSRSQKPEAVYIYNGGSFLNPHEIPLKTQLDICRDISRHQIISTLFVESRPEFVRPETIIPLKKALSFKSLEIGLGLEAVSDVVREVFIHKGFTCQDYERAVKLLKDNGIRVLTYVFLKPLGLSEKEAIEEAVQTIEYAFSAGSDEVSLSCAFIQEGTLMGKAYREGKFRPPWLWSIIEVVRRTANLGPVKIGSFIDEPAPIAIPHNCGKCDIQILKILEEYNLFRNTKRFSDVSCDCQTEWRRKNME